MNRLIGVAALLTVSSAAAQTDMAASTVGGYVGQVSSLVFETRTELAPAVTGARRAEICQFTPNKVQTLLDRGNELVTSQRNVYAASATPTNASLYLAATQARGALLSIQEGVNAACTYAREPLAASVASLALKVAQLEVELAFGELGKAFEPAAAK
ncbi:hypothetical protein QOL99_13010 [Deinococcus sp. MIMF12]|uniref:Uncharacterized protein n=1 Tax=Deinococcus rhizophilus TaxID=3049544 RepID=A0ABT7JKP5_9DEIO|nr:hypothetical protein [Deinococcus rhizophilus]MDL2345065.1 hypothetical protein [Deinococcus rhizophilus]